LSREGTGRVVDCEHGMARPAVVPELDSDLVILACKTPKSHIEHGCEMAARRVLVEETETREPRKGVPTSAASGGPQYFE
jgi:AmiR/NasT family two-component response regulator